MVYRCLALFLLISLLLHAFSLPQEREVWDEALVPWLRRSRRRYHRRALGSRLCFLSHAAWGLKRRGLVLPFVLGPKDQGLCRLGLVAALLVWNGWSQRRPLSWGLLSLPLADAISPWA